MTTAGTILVLAALTLVEGGASKFTIVAPPDGPPAYAAREIQKYVREMTGVELPIAAEAPSPRIIIQVVPGAAAHDGYVLRREGKDVLIEAAHPRGCIFGAYELLRLLGCRFYGPGPLGVVVPKTKSLELPEKLHVKREPAFPNRFPSSGSPEQQMQWGFNHTGVAGRSERLELVKKLGLIQYRFGHLWPTLLKKRFFADGRKPEKADFTGKEGWLPADAAGKRRETRKSLCFSNPDALAWFADNAANYVLSECRNADYLSLWSADEWRIALCRCEKCKARGWNATDWYLLTHNEIKKRLNERGWKGIFGWIVYHGSEFVPTKVDLLDHGRKMDMLYAPRPRGGAQHGPFTSDDPVTTKYRENLRGWKEYLARQKYEGTRTVFEYYYDLVLLGPLAAGRAFLIPKHDVMQEDIRFYKEHGFDGFFDCCPPGGAWWPDPLSRWLYHRLLWDVDLDLQAARRDFFEHYYGPAAQGVREIREAVEELMFEPPCTEVVDKLKALEPKLDKIRTKDETIGKRLRSFRLWVRYCALCKESELHQKVTKDQEKGCSAELAIRKLLNDNKDFLVNNGFMGRGDLDYVALTVVSRHLQAFFRPAWIRHLGITLDFQVRASGEYWNNPRELAFDGKPSTCWNAGKGPPAWIEMVYRQPREICRLELAVHQVPAGATRHEVIVKDASGQHTVKVFEGHTKTGDVLKADFDPSLKGVKSVRILTTESPSWVCWREIRVE